MLLKRWAIAEKLSDCTVMREQARTCETVAEASIYAQSQNTDQPVKLASIAAARVPACEMP